MRYLIYLIIKEPFLVSLSAISSNHLPAIQYFIASIQFIFVLLISNNEGFCS